MWYRRASQENLGEQLRRLMSSNESYDILGDEGTWTAGGCWILSEALRRHLGDDARLMALADDWCPHQHVVTQVGDRYYDADGESDEASLLARWREQESLVNPRLVDFDPEVARYHGIPEDEERVARLHEWLKQRL